MKDKPEPSTGSDDIMDIFGDKPEQQSSAIMILKLAWVVILCVVCSACAIWVLR